MANNPTLDVLTEIAEYNLALRSADRADEVIEPEVMLSLGTGVPPIRKVSKIPRQYSGYVRNMRNTLSQRSTKYHSFSFNRPQWLIYSDQKVH